MNVKTLKSFAVPSQKSNKGPRQFTRIAGNAGNHGKDGKFHESHQILNQTKGNTNRLCLRKVSRQKVVRIKFSMNFACSNMLYGIKQKPKNAGKQQKVF